MYVCINIFSQATGLRKVGKYYESGSNKVPCRLSINIDSTATVLSRDCLLKVDYK